MQVYAKGTKKFWDRTQELWTETVGQPQAERDLVPREHIKGRKPEFIKDVFRG